VPWLLNHVTKTRRREAFVLSVMLLCLGTGWATSQVGLSMALGAFLAGLIISESEYSHQALSDVLPFREVFNFLVFVSIGMLFDFRVLIEQPGAVAFSLFALLAIKTGVIFLVTFALGHSIRVSLLSGFYLAQASEFSFILAKLGLAEGVIDPKLNQLVCAVAILSMAVTPLLTTIASYLANWADRNLPASWTSRQRPLPTDEPKLTNHVVIIGFGLAGKMLAKALERTQIQYIAIDHDPAVVSNSRACGTPIFYGDAASQSVLEHAHIEGARMVVVTIPDQSNAIQTVATVRRLNEGIHIVALTRSIEQIAPLSKAGASHVIAEAAVGGVEVIRGVLRTSKVNEDEISDCIKFAYHTAAPGRDDSK